jgi:hypothetical protein
MGYPEAWPLAGLISRKEIPDTVCPNCTVSFQNVFDFESNWITSNFKVTATNSASPLQYFDLALGYSEDGGHTFVSKVQTTAVLDVADKIKVYQGSLIDGSRDLSKPVDGACIGYASTLSDQEPCSFFEDFSYKPPAATVFGGTPQTNYVEIKNRSKSNSLQSITLVFLDAADEGNERNVVLTDEVLPGKSFRFDFINSGLSSRVTLFHFEWMYQGNSMQSEPTNPKPGSYFVWIKASVNPDGSFFSFSAAQSSV